MVKNRKLYILLMLFVIKIWGFYRMSEQGIVYFEQPKIVKAGKPFYDSDLAVALEQAQKYAGTDGNVASMLDIAKAKILADKEDFVWKDWFTTITGEYKGLSSQGNPVFVVAHGVGPFTRPGRIRQDREEGLVRGAGKLESKEFYDLLAQEDGEKVIVLDGKKVQECKSGVMSVSDAENDLLIRARVGGHTEDYLGKHKKVWGDEIYSYHDLNGIDWEVPQGRLLFAGDNLYFSNLDGYSNLYSYGRFVGVQSVAKISTGSEGVLRPSLEQILALKEFVPELLHKQFEERAKDLYN